MSKIEQAPRSQEQFARSNPLHTLLEIEPIGKLIIHFLFPKGSNVSSWFEPAEKWTTKPIS